MRVWPWGQAGAAWLRVAELSPMIIATTIVVGALGYLQKVPCRSIGFDYERTVQRACYTDIYPLYFVRGLADGKVPYLDDIPEPVEYPVLTGWFMQAISALVRWTLPNAAVQTRGMAFFDLTVVALGLLAVLAVLATMYAAGAGRALKAGLMCALAPGLLLAAYINWDLLAVALSALAIAAWAGCRPALAGSLLGLAISAKFYPLVFLWPFVLLCLRAGQWRGPGGGFPRGFGGRAGSGSTRSARNDPSTGGRSSSLPPRTAKPGWETSTRSIWSASWRSGC